LPGGGKITSAQPVTINDPTLGATIYYTTDGTTPTMSSAVYKAAIPVSSTEILNAIASAPNYSISPIATATYTILPYFSFTGTNVTVAPGATTGNTSTITLTSGGGFTGAIALSCAITPTAASDPATCSIPSSATITGAGPQTAVLTVTTTPPTTARNDPARIFWPSMGGSALACLLLVGLPSRRRKRFVLPAIALVSFLIVASALGCSGHLQSGGGGGGGNPGTTPGTYTITIMGTAGSLTEQATLTLSVQ
jgi:hypothetical protein